ncbi:hypothetical protein LIA77_00540 [Sarocladium implicatum]|nr:hypothetical protein LIA77_00540 [Sarocladium implicatum]
MMRLGTGDSSIWVVYVAVFYWTHQNVKHISSEMANPVWGPRSLPLVSVASRKDAAGATSFALQVPGMCHTHMGRWFSCDPGVSRLLAWHGNQCSQVESVYEYAWLHLSYTACRRRTDILMVRRSSKDCCRARVPKCVSLDDRLHVIATVDGDLMTVPYLAGLSNAWLLHALMCAV